MELCLLADYPAAIPRIASWYFDEWGKTRPGRTVARIAEDLKAYLNRGKVPLMVVAVEEQVVIGAAQLKFREMEIYPNRVHWLGGVFVDPQHRANGLGAKLANRIAEIAGALEVTTLYLQTVRPDGGLYASLGWRRIDRVRSEVGDVVVMERHLLAPCREQSPQCKCRLCSPMACGQSRSMKAHRMCRLAAPVGQGVSQPGALPTLTCLQCSGLKTRLAEGGWRASLSKGRRGRGSNSPPQFGHRPPSTSWAQEEQNVHSKEQILACADSGGRSLSQHSQLGRSSSIANSPLFDLPSRAYSRSRRWR